MAEASYARAAGERPLPAPPLSSAAASPRTQPRHLARDAARRAFLRTVSHELRTPLNAIIGFSELIADELHGPLGDPRYREHAAVVRDSGMQLLALVSQILDIARLEAGAMDLDLRPELVCDVLDEALAGVALAADARQLRLSLEGVTGQARVMCDRRALRTVLAALLEEAVRSSPPGGCVRVNFRRLGEHAAIEVWDEGEGAERRELLRLANAQSEGELALVRRGLGAGAGLGLPLARLLAQAMGGRLRLRSRPGEGSMAMVRLRLA